MRIRVGEDCSLLLALLIVTSQSGWLHDAQAEELSIQPLTLRSEDASPLEKPGLIKGSHIKVFLPSLPYLYTSHAINGALIKPSDNPQRWEYHMATGHDQIDETTYVVLMIVWHVDTPRVSIIPLVSIHVLSYRNLT